MAAYRRARSLDIASRMTGVDALNRSLLSGLLPVNLARGIGLQIVQKVPLLRRQVIAMGMNPPGPLPRLMRADTMAA
jgi:2-octaprenyl-6-methoxyphenol hydroxylase